MRPGILVPHQTDFDKFSSWGKLWSSYHLQEGNHGKQDICVVDLTAEERTFLLDFINRGTQSARKKKACPHSAAGQRR
jgi:hypothetical protein